MTDKLIKLKNRCVSCGHKKFRVLNGWEWRGFKFHCLITCQRCFRTAHGWGRTPKSAYENAVKEWEKNNEQSYR